eukprot:TRINITY_DN17203_c0_g1_i1.p1 TRINITY_DN17203_c0_g1~~TRINITY_DN17203_c0_g1_i1.p1  ORF type:complete len:363 (-),score=41.76 TRINITY_DN17203_c0_g1_i1:129-1169(-)
MAYGSIEVGGILYSPNPWGRHKPSPFLFWVLVLFTVFSMMITTNHLWRGGEREPFLDEIAAAHVCSHPPTGTCAVDMSAVTAGRFDLHEAENPLLGFIFKQLFDGSRSELREVLCGAHVVLNDPTGAAYAFLTSLPGATRRVSSHRSDRVQYGIDEGRVVSELLVGMYQNATWFQLEGNPWDPFRQPYASFKHTLDFLEYMLLWWNVGPQGVSQFTERNPLRVSKILSVAEACSKVCGLSFKAGSSSKALSGQGRRGLFGGASIPSSSFMAVEASTDTAEGVHHRPQRSWSTMDSILGVGSDLLPQSTVNLDKLPNAIVGMPAQTTIIPDLDDEVPHTVRIRSLSA